MSEQKKPKTDKYEKLTQNILDLIQDESKHLEFKDFVRKTLYLRNAVTKNMYHGGNTVQTLIDVIFNHRKSFDFVTFKQGKDAGFKMRKGSKGVPIFYYGKVEPDEDEDKKGFMFVKYSNVFNLDCFELTDEQKEKYSQTAELKDATVKSENEKIEKLKSLAKIEVTKVTKAFYTPQKDFIHMPSIEAFENKDHWHEVFFHELTHWTGHDNRLKRNLKGRQGHTSYSKEELTAELGSFFFCLDLGIKKDISSGAAYLKGYLKKASKKELFEAMNRAIKAVEYCYKKAGIIE